MILSDYGKGGLAHIATMIERARAAGKPVLVDPKGDEWDTYRGATVITPNRGEFRQVVGRWSDAGEMAAKAQALRAELDVDGAARHAFGGGDEPLHGRRAPRTSRPLRARSTTFPAPATR